MGKLESEVKIRTRKSKIKVAILTTLAVTLAGMLNPQALVRGVMKELAKPKEKRRASQNAIYVARGRLMRQGLIKYQKGFWNITEKGRSFFKLIQQFDKKLDKPKRWDKKWRILIFDIREEKKSLRDKIRRTLTGIGFKHLQDSVWIYPYDCEDFVALLKAEFKIGKDLLYIIADAVENDIELRKFFGLM